MTAFDRFGDSEQGTDKVDQLSQNFTISETLESIWRKALMLCDIHPDKGEQNPRDSENRQKKLQ